MNEWWWPFNTGLGYTSSGLLFELGTAVNWTTFYAIDASPHVSFNLLKNILQLLILLRRYLNAFDVGRTLVIKILLTIGPSVMYVLMW